MLGFSVIRSVWIHIIRININTFWRTAHTVFAPYQIYKLKNFQLRHYMGANSPNTKQLVTKSNAFIYLWLMLRSRLIDRPTAGRPDNTHNKHIYHIIYKYSIFHSISTHIVCGQDVYAAIAGCPQLSLYLYI